MRHSRSWEILLMLTAVASGYSQTSTPQVDAVRRADTYAIYSLLVTGISGDTSTLFIAAKPLQELYPQCYRAIPPNPVPPPLPEINEVAWREVLAERAGRKDSPGTIEPVLASKRPYVLLGENEVREFAANPNNPKFQGARELLWFSDVYFDRGRTIALVGLATSRTSTSANWQVFKKSPSGEWQSTVNCNVN